MNYEIFEALLAPSMSSACGAVPWARRCAPHERVHEAESRGYELAADSSSWLPSEPEHVAWDEILYPAATCRRIMSG